MEDKELIAKIKRNNQEIKRLINRKLPQNNGVDEEEIVKNEILKNMKCYREAAARGLRVPERDFIIGVAMSYFLDYESLYEDLYGESISEMRDRLAGYNRERRK